MTTKRFARRDDNQALPLLRMTRLGSRLTAAPRARRRLLFPDLNRYDVAFCGRGADLATAGNGHCLTRLLVHEPLALVVAEDHLILVDLLDILGQERNLATAP